MEYKTIREICSLVVDCPHSTPTWTDSGKVVLRNFNIRNGKIDLSSPSFTDDEHFQQRIRRAKPMAGDIVITREAPMGEVGMVPENVECCLGQRMVLLRVGDPNVNKKYLLYSLMSKYVQHQISWSEGTGTTVSNLRIPHLEQLKIPIMSLCDQDKIASILSALDDKIALNQKINANLQTQAAAVFCDSFKGSAEGTLSDICEYSNDRVAVSDLNLDNYFSTENMLPNKQGVSQASGLPSTAQTSRCSVGDVLVSNIRPYFKKIYYCHDDGGCSADVLCFRPKHEDLSAFLFYALYDDSFFDFMMAGSKGTKMPRGDKKQIMTYPIAMPSDEELASFNSFARPMIETIKTNAKVSNHLAAIRDALLPKLMSGEIDVSGVEVGYQND